MRFQAPFANHVECPLIFTYANNHPFVTNPLAKKTLEHRKSFLLKFLEMIKILSGYHPQQTTNRQKTTYTVPTTHHHPTDFPLTHRSALRPRARGLPRLRTVGQGAE
jgi:hypothetical protein